MRSATLLTTTATVGRLVGLIIVGESDKEGDLENIATGDKVGDDVTGNIVGKTVGNFDGGSGIAEGFDVGIGDSSALGIWVGRSLGDIKLVKEGKIVGDTVANI